MCSVYVFMCSWVRSSVGNDMCSAGKSYIGMKEMNKTKAFWFSPFETRLTKQWKTEKKTEAKSFQACWMEVELSPFVTLLYSLQSADSFKTQKKAKWNRCFYLSIPNGNINSGANKTYWKENWIENRAFGADFKCNPRRLLPFDFSDVCALNGKKFLCTSCAWFPQLFFNCFGDVINYSGIFADKIFIANSKSTTTASLASSLPLHRKCFHWFFNQWKRVSMKANKTSRFKWNFNRIHFDVHG